MSGVPTILARIVARTRADLAARRGRVPSGLLREEASRRAPALDVAGLLSADAARHGQPAVIAEVKKASPSKGVLRAEFDPVAIARSYAAAGAAAISVLTDEPFFEGSLDYLRAIRDALPGVPLLRKDFVVDPYQVEEARAAGADAVLLIAACLDDATLAGLHADILGLGMTPLVEAHGAAEVGRCLRIDGLRLLGINNRDLHDFVVDLDTTRRGFEAIEAARRDRVVLVSESGIASGADVARVAAAGARAVLVGEHFMRAADPGEGLRALRRDAASALRAGTAAAAAEGAGGA